MESRNSDNLYIYSDNNGMEEQFPSSQYNDLDTSGPNFSQSINESEEDDDVSEKTTCKSSSLMLMFKILFNPIEGWKSLRRSHLTQEEVQRGCFYPLAALLAVSRFADMFYNPAVKLDDCIMSAVSSFISFFFGYFCILIIIRILMPSDISGIFDKHFGKIYILMSLSSLCLFYTVTALLPMLWAVLIFLPLWTVYIIFRGSKFLKFPESRHIRYVTILCILIIGSPLALSWVMEIILDV